MLAQQTLRRPANWQDFEHLCFRVYGEEWKCPEIQMHGRLGQDQSGVDIYGTPASETGIWGIQCKGKSEYNDNQYHHPQFTPQEIDDEIAKARSFEPALRKLYFLTTAKNDAKIQKHVRMRNQEHIESGLFEVHMFSWEYLVTLIEKNRETYEWYHKNQMYRVDRAAEITFPDGSTETEIRPKFRKTTTHYYPAVPIDQLYPGGSIASEVARLNRQFEGLKQIQFDSEKKTANLSFVPIQLLITNTGIASVEDFKLTFFIEGDIERIAKTNIRHPQFAVANFQKTSTNVSLFPSGIGGQVIPTERSLVGKDSLISNDIFLRPSVTAKSIIIKWQLVAKEFNMEGELLVHVKPQIVTEYKEVREEDITRPHRTVEGQVEEFIEIL